MSPHAQIRAELDQLFELNRLFLEYLRQLSADGIADAGLPAATARWLRRAKAAALDRAAEFPQALFRLRLDEAGVGDALDDGPHGDARRALQLTIMLCAWNQCRQSVYAARLYLGLGNDDVRRLRTTSLSELTGLAVAGDLLGCAFARSEWFWRELLTAGGRERRRQLALIGLQPKLAQGWRIDHARPRLSSM